MIQPQAQIGYLPMSLDRHDPQAVASLIYESAPELFTLMFGPWAIGCLTDLIPRSHNRFSYQYIRVAELDRRIVGIATLLPAAALSDQADYLDRLNLSQRLWLHLIEQLLLRHLLQHDYPAGSFYIGNLAVAPECRNQGIGRQLLGQCIAEASIAEAASFTEAQDPAAETNRIYISVDVSNSRAQKLYESLGFQEVGTKTIRLFGVAIGSRSLALSIPRLVS